MRALAALLPAAAAAPPNATARASVPDPSRFSDFLKENVSPGSGMPLSYMVWPRDYFSSVPDSEKSNSYSSPEYAGQPCDRQVQPQELNNYQFQSEQMLSATGLNIYDGAVWVIAQTLLGNQGQAQQYMTNVLLSHKTFQLADIRGDAPCKGKLFDHSCVDPNATGLCGFCYGDGMTTQDIDHAYMFRMIGDYYALDGTVDARCPEKGQAWAWNDWKPILGENAWASILGPMVSAVVSAGGNPAAVARDGTEMLLAKHMVTTLMSMRVGDTGAIYYTPHNTFFHSNPNAGASVSTENQASTLAALKSLQWVLRHQSNPDTVLLCDIAQLIAEIEKYLFSAWQGQYFRQGGTYDSLTNTFTWAQGDSPQFAVDCQTWVGSVLGPEKMDGQLGAGTSATLWELVKSRSGYKKQGNGYVKGVGYTDNNGYGGEVLSGEWTFGAINWLRILAASSVLSAEKQRSLVDEANYMRDAVEAELVMSSPVQKGSASRPSIKYASRRYWIPFGWWANPVPALASTGWAVAVDKGFNPLMANGALAADYPDGPTPEQPCAGGPPAPKPAPPPKPRPTPQPGSIPNSCSKCLEGACCNPKIPDQRCPGNLPCCDCGTEACQCHEVAPPGPNPTPAPPGPQPPTPPPGPAQCSVCTSGACCDPVWHWPLCPGGVPCCDCGAQSCQCPTSAPPPPGPPVPTPPPVPQTCAPCSAGAVCCDPSDPIGLCPGSIVCCDCGSNACTCPSGGGGPAPAPAPAPPSPPGTCQPCAYVGGGEVCCDPNDSNQFCPGGAACCACGKPACKC